DRRVALGRPTCLPAGRGPLVQRPLRCGLVDEARGGAKRGGRGVRVAAVGGRDDPLGRRLQAGTYGLVAHPGRLVLLVALDLGLDVGHGGRVYQRVSSIPPRTLGARWTSRASGTSASSRTSTTASRRW